MIKIWQLVLVILLCSLGLTACGDDVEKFGVSVDGVDYITAENISVQRFSVNGSDMGPAIAGIICCVMLPKKWHPGLNVKVTWNETNWRDCTGKNYEAVVPVEPYKEEGRVYVAFFDKHKVRVVVSNYPIRGALMPGSKFPIKVEIPQKKPWDKWPPHKHCPHKFD